MSRQPAADHDPRSTVQVVQDATEHAQLLLRKELELAKLELQEALTRQAIGAGLAIGGAVLGLFVLGFAGVTLAVVLQQVARPWVAWTLVTVGYLLVGVVALLVARRLFVSTSLTPERTKKSIEENVEWARQQLRR